MTKEKETNDSSAEDAKTTEKSTETDNKKVAELSDEQWELAFKHPRFKDLTEKAKELEKLKADLSKKEEIKLKENEEYKTLAEKKEQEIIDLKKSIANQNKKQAIMAEAFKLGVRKEALEDIVRLVDLDSVESDDSGNPLNITPLVKNLLETKPYLLADEGKKNIGNETGTATDGKSQFWKMSEIQKKSRDNKWYEDNKAEIEKARAEGRINYKE